VSRPGRSLTPEKTRYPLYMRLDGPQGRSGQMRKISPPPGFDLRTAHAVASRYTDWATRPTFYLHLTWQYKTHVPILRSVESLLLIKSHFTTNVQISSTWINARLDTCDREVLHPFNSFTSIKISLVKWPFCWDLGFESHQEGWIFVCCECRVLSGRGLCDELIARPE
jgi:hypothetical protein